MRPVSPAQAKVNRARRRTIQAEHGRPPCHRQAICGNPADDLHELVNRSQGGDPTDVTIQVWLCRACHDWVGEHPVEAEAEGLYVPGARYRRQTMPSPDDRCIQTAMPKTTAKPALLQFRATASAAEFIAGLVERHGTDRTTVLRAMFRVASLHPDEIDRQVRLMIGDPEPAPAARPGRAVPKPSQGGRG
jgi:hypothetical protein